MLLWLIPLAAVIAVDCLGAWSLFRHPGRW
jgi:hypothetical protein